MNCGLLMWVMFAPGLQMAGSVTTWGHRGTFGSLYPASSPLLLLSFCLRVLAYQQVVCVGEM